MTAINSSIGLPPRNLWFYVLKLLRMRWTLYVSGFKRAKPLRKTLTLFLGLLVLGVSVGCFFLTTAFLKLLDSPAVQESGVNLDAFVDALPALIVSGAFLSILLTSFGVLLQVLYLTDDMDFLLTTPIPVRAVFLTKLLQAILPSFILVVLIGLPVFFGLGMAGGYHFLFFPLVLVMFAFLSLAAAGISSLLVMTIVRIIPAKRVAEVLAFLGVILFVGLSQGSNLINFRSLTPDQISKGAQLVSTFNNAWSPLAWGGRALVDLGSGRFSSGILYLALTLGLSGGLFWAALNTSERLYITGWASLQASAPQKKTTRAVKHRAENGSGANAFLRILPPEVRAIMAKDYLEVRRDLRNMSQVITPLTMGIVFAIMAIRSGGGSTAGQDPKLFTDFWTALGGGSMPISLLVGWTLVTRLALISFSMEGRSYWLIRTSPVSAGKQLAAKFLTAYLPALFLSWLFLLGIAILKNVPPATILYSIPSVAAILAGSVGINLALGVRFANLSWTDPRRMWDGIISYVGLIGGALYLLLSLLLFFAPVVGMPSLGFSEGIGKLAGLLAGGSVTLLCMILPLALVKSRVYRIGEE